MRFTKSLSNNLLNVSSRDSSKILTLNDPKRHHALSLAMLTELNNELATGASDYRSLVILSAGPKVFCAGHDLKELQTAAGRVQHKDIFDLCKNVMRQIREIDVPVICAVNGIAAAAGCQLVAGCDIVLADRKSKFSVPGVNLGIYCHSPGVELGRAVPKKVAMHMLTTGQYLSAEDAYSLGLVSKLTSDDKTLDDLIDETIRAVNATSRSVQAMGKLGFYNQIEADIVSAADSMGDAMVENLSYLDTQNGINSFLKKEKPTWTHTDAKDE